MSRFALAAVVLAVFVLSGCDDPRARLVAHQGVAERSGDRLGVANQLEADFRAGRVSLGLALDHAFLTLERDERTFVYVGAVLDFASFVEDAIPRDPALSTILLRRIGRLAFQAAEAAYLAGDVALARSLVLAGPARWRSQPYWTRYPDHDALAAMLLAATGERAEALRRLNSRPVLTGPAEEAFGLIRAMRP